jgi:molecular chaperone DnaK
MDTVTETLQAAKLTPSDIDIVLAVGGSSRTPKIHEELRRIFGDKIRGGINPDEAVALGAAVQAGINSNEISGENAIAIFDVCNHTLGTDVLNASQTDLEYSRLIMRDTHLPFAMTRRYTTASDFQKFVDVTVYQGESDDLSQNAKIGSFIVDGIPENYAGKEAIDIEFKYNINGILEVNVTIVSTNKVASTTISMFDYDAPKSKSEEKMDDILNGAWTQASEIKTTVMLYQSRRAGLPEDAKKQADELMRKLKEAVVNNDTKQIEYYDDYLTALLFEY